ncbi:ABC transporter ATP-binding protein [Streptococcus pacificus]|uniref:ABC transporter ATP-binding protein n=1 Tax=Streptococcus pacificus TaxID=2740577 RepID=A0ABS0ZIS9_9STRE|nr:ABC transporter ATP-binding protein [Streptococcus pacificus]MBJ8325924.1 ABC transporter ATP-binding protein [Streptococcus pacificus]
MNKQPAISVNHLKKQFKEKTILDDLSFEIFEGDCLALIGPNGAGKTVLMTCLLGDYQVTSGTIEVLGYGANDHRLKKRVGVLFQDNLIQDKMTVQELIDFQRALYPNPLNEKEIDDLLAFNPKQKKQFASKLSGGQRRLLDFVLTLIGQPDIIFLDEPTTAMDTSTRKRFWEIINHLKTSGKTIIYSSHYIEEVEHTADRILVLHEGKLLKDTTPYLLRSEEKSKHFVLPKKYLDDIDQTIISNLELKNDTISFMTKKPNAIWQSLVEANCPIEAIEMTNRTLLDSIFDSRKDTYHDHI